MMQTSETLNLILREPRSAEGAPRAFCLGCDSAVLGSDLDQHAEKTHKTPNVRLYYSRAAYEAAQ